MIQSRMQNKKERVGSQKNGQGPFDQKDQFLKQIMNALSDGAMVIDSDFKIKDVNKRFLEIYGLKKDDVLNCYCYDIINNGSNPCNFSKNKCPLRSVFQSGERSNFKHNFTDERGIEHIRKYTALPLAKNNGHTDYVLELFHDELDEHVINTKLKETESKYDILFNSLPEMIVLIDLEGKIIDCNDIAAKIIGASKKRLVNKPFNELEIFNDDEISRLLSIYPKAKKLNDIGPIDFELRMGKDQNWVEVYPAPIIINKKLIGIQLIFKNITERKRSEKEMKMHMLKFQLEDGRSYLVKEAQPTMTLEGFKELLKLGYQGLVISRMPEKDFKELIRTNDYDFYWLAEKGEDCSIKPKAHDILNLIEVTFKTNPSSNAVLITGLDYLITRNGFKNTASLLQLIKETIYLSGNIAFFTIDPQTLNNRELRHLELECDQMRPRLIENKLSEPQIKVLRYIYKNNLTGERPSYTDIGQALGLSKPTVRKRVRTLKNAGFMCENIRGRNKVLELTKVGRELIN